MTTPPKSFGTQAAQSVADLANQSDVVRLWNLRESDHADAVLCRLCSVTFDEYSRRVSDAQAQFAAQGVKVELVDVTPGRLSSIIRWSKLPFTPDGIAAAIAIACRRVPGRAFPGMNADLDAFRQDDFFYEIYGPFEVIRTPCSDDYGQVYDGWILPSEPKGTTYLCGWFEGRRSVK